MKKFFTTLLATLIVVLPCILYREQIVTFIMGTINQNITINPPKQNEYATNYKFEFVTTSDNFHVQNRQDILNVIYTILNSGKNNYNFYCDINYKNCSDDLKTISEDQTLLSTINNMVSPYNSYEKLYITINAYGKAEIKIDKLYTAEEMNQINEKIDVITNQTIRDDMSDQDKIKAYHDYLIDHTSYDEDRAKLIEQGQTDNAIHNSHKASGPLLEGWALCSGYSDAMKLFLDRLNLPNYKIANSNHIWNYVYINGKWLHLDLTWDDPVTSDHSNLILHKFFLIDTNTLLSLDITNHDFNKSYYPEAS